MHRREAIAVIGAGLASLVTGRARRGGALEELRAAFGANWLPEWDRYTEADVSVVRRRSLTAAEYIAICESSRPAIVDRCRIVGELSPYGRVDDGPVGPLLVTRCQLLRR